VIKTAAASPLASTANPATAAKLEKLKAAAHQFEAVFARQMISSMRSANIGEDILGSDAQNQFRDMSDAKLADSMADKGTFGIAQLLIKQFSGQVAGSATANAEKAGAVAEATKSTALADAARATK
jgi:flagellar protein FlgJ